ncbi:MAG: metallophosphoesterase [Ruminococcus sp.]|nr:metallophosphoesterase [Ruminococcus sp.]
MNEGEKPAASEKKTPESKYRFRRMSFLIIIILLIWWFNNFTLKVTKVEITSDKISSPVRIAMISDLHVSDFSIVNKKIIKKICGQEPDIVVVAGDMYSTGSDMETIDIAVDLIEGIVDEGYPVYVVTGEHDTDQEYIDAVSETGACVMNYEEKITDLNGNKFQIIGIDNVYYSDTFDLRKEFTIRDDCFSLLLAHIPNYDKLSLFGADLTLCADTHGEMVQLPFDLGPVYSSDYGSWFPQLTKDQEIYDKGLFSYKGGNMFITSGAGVSPAPIRFNNRPEIAIIDLIPE